MHVEILPIQYKVYIPTALMDSLKDCEYYEQLMQNGGTIYTGTGVWRGEEESVSVHEIFSTEYFSVVIDQLAQYMLDLGQEAVLTTTEGLPRLFTDGDSMGRRF